MTGHHNAPLLGIMFDRFSAAGMYRHTIILPKHVSSTNETLRTYNTAKATIGTVATLSLSQRNLLIA